MELGADIRVVRNDEVTLGDIKKLNPEKIIISPGPGNPDESGVCLDVIDEFGGTLPILGICLGHQAIAQCFGAEIVRSKNIMHGKTSTIIQTKDTKIFNDLPSEFTQTRYHSLIVESSNLPSDIVVTSTTDEDEIMSLEIKDKNIYGVQFHPESIMSEHGHKILGNFLNI
jgi:anthranilate synthase component 2